MNLNDRIENVKMSKVCNIKPDGTSDERKQITLEIDYSGLTLGDVIAKAVRTDVITWQNGQGRKNFDKLIDKQVVKISASKPATAQIDPMEALIAQAKAAGMDIGDFIKAELAKRNS